jgi:tetratricopeptide (TPR) repeat protein
LNERALVAAKNGQWEEALRLSQELLELDPTLAEVHNRIGKALSELGRFQEAHAAFQRAIEVDAHNPIAQRNLKRLEVLKDLPDAPNPGYPVVRSLVYIEETGKTAIVSLARPADRPTRMRMMSGDPLELRIDYAAGVVSVYSLEGVYLGEIEPRIGERVVEFSRGGNRYSAAIIEHEEDTLRIIIHEVFQDPSLSDRLSFPTRVRGTAPRAYIRKDILYDVGEEADLLLEGDEEEMEVEEVEEEPELEDEEFSDSDDSDSGL